VASNTAVITDALLSLGQYIFSDVVQVHRQLNTAEDAEEAEEAEEAEDAEALRLRLKPMPQRFAMRINTAEPTPGLRDPPYVRPPKIAEMEGGLL
jgi:hypothetical protein